MHKIYLWRTHEMKRQMWEMLINWNKCRERTEGRWSGAKGTTPLEGNEVCLQEAPGDWTVWQVIWERDFHMMCMFWVRIQTRYPPEAVQQRMCGEFCLCLWPWAEGRSPGHALHAGCLHFGLHPFDWGHTQTPGFRVFCHFSHLKPLILQSLLHWHLTWDTDFPV